MADIQERTTDDRAIPSEYTRHVLEQKLERAPDFIEEDFTEDRRPGRHGRVYLAASATLPTRFGDFKMYGFYDERNRKEHTALVRGEIAGMRDVPVRVHSQCHTGDVWGSLRCDCRDQLEAAIEYIGSRDAGAIVYMKQEGRGIGLLNKIKAYQLQDLGLDTIEANHYLGFPAEARDYAIAARIIELLEIESVALLTNNPDKIVGLEAEGIEIARRIPVVIPANRHNEAYLETKKSEMGHLL